MRETEKNMVDHLTRVILKPLEEPLSSGNFRKSGVVDAQGVRDFGLTLQDRTERMALMMELLSAQGFVFSVKQGAILADSSVIEAQEIKTYLLNHGFINQEFQVFLEYGRKWGIM